MGTEGGTAKTGRIVQQSQGGRRHGLLTVRLQSRDSGPGAPRAAFFHSAGATAWPFSTPLTRTAITAGGTTKPSAIIAPVPRRRANAPPPSRNAIAATAPPPATEGPKRRDADIPPRHA